MARAWADDEAQLAAIDEAEDRVLRALAGDVSHRRERFMQIGFDLDAFASEVGQRVEAARDARAWWCAAEVDRKIESRQAARVADELDDWFEILEAVVEHALQEGHPRAAGLLRLLEDLDVASWSQGVDSVTAALVRLEDEGQGLTKFGLPADFVARGRDLARRLSDEQAELLTARSQKSSYHRKLRMLLDRLVADCARIDSARRLLEVLDRTSQRRQGVRVATVARAKGR